jgi:hypothetical protein
VIGIAKAFTFLVSPLQFAVGKARLSAIVSWIFAALSIGTVVGACMALDQATLQRQLLGVAGSRAILYLLVLLPISLAIIVRISGLSVHRIARQLPGSLVAGGVTFAILTALNQSHVLDDLHPVVAALIAGAVAVVCTGGLLLALDGRVRREAKFLLGRTRRTPYQSSSA